MRKHIVMLSALVAAFASFAAPFTDGGVTYTPNNEVSRYQPVVTGVNVTGMVESVAYTKGEVDRRIETNAPVRSVNGKTGRVVLGAGDVGALPNNRDGLKENANFRNAVWDVQIKPGGANEGAARVLPPYLHEIEFDSTYPADAAWYYAHADYSDAGMCSVRRTGNTVERNFDWKFDFMPEFVLRTTAAEGRFASLGIASVGKLLTETDVISGKWSPYYRCLPGHTVDGVNEKGVFCEVNVVDGDPDWDNPSGDIHPLGGVRWVLDYGTNAQQAAEALASRIAFPSGWSQNFHYLVADRDETWIVENGAAHKVTGTAVMTNFKLYPSRDTDGAGQERYDLLADGEPITNAWWTLAYLAKTSPVRVSDIGTDTNAIFSAWAYGDRESHRGQAAGGKTWWQTVHTAVYDLDDLSLRVCVQEQNDWYMFAVPSAGGVNPEAVREIVEPIVGSMSNALDAAKRDYTDLKLEEPKNVHWVWTSNDPSCPEGWLAEANKFGAPKPVWEAAIEMWSVVNIGGYSALNPSLTEDALSVYFYFENTFSATATRASATDTTPVKVDEIALVSQLPSAEQLLTAEQRTAIADVANKLAKADVVAPGASATAGQAADAKDTHDALAKKADEFAFLWTYSSIPDGVSVSSQPYFGTMNGEPWWLVDDDSGNRWMATGPEHGDPDADYLVFTEDTYLYTFIATRTATRKRVLRTGDAATPQELADAISTNNPAFVSAVRDTPPDDDAPWGEYGTVGAAIAGLVALVALMAKRSAFAPEYSAESAYAVGEYVWHDGGLYQCKTAIASPGEAWTAAHWDGPQKLDDFFSESNSLLTGVIDARLPYPLYAVPTATGMLKDRALNTTSLASVTVPDDFTDLLVRATVATSLPVTMPTAITTKYGDTFPDAEGEYLITITKTGAAEAYVRVIKLEVANA